MGGAFDVLVGPSAAAGAEAEPGLITLKQFVGISLGFFAFMQLVARFVQRNRTASFTSKELSNLRATQARRDRT
jgi:hypothetical protein